jgi:tetratricopeptide (TPR) repeat protein
MKPQTATLLILMTGLWTYSLRGADGPTPGVATSGAALGKVGEQTRLGADRLRKQGQPAEAERLLLKFVELHADEAPGHVLAYIYNDLGTLNQEQHQVARAYRYYKQSIADWERSGERFSLHAATTMNNLATLLWDDGRLAESHQTLVRSAGLIERFAGPASPALIQLHYNLGNVRMTLNRHQEAEESYRKFLAIANPKAGRNHVLQTILVTNDLGLLTHKESRTAETGSYFGQSQRSWAQFREGLQAGGGEQRDLDPSLLLNLAQSFWKSGATGQAAEVTEVLLSLVESRAGVGYPRLSHVLSLQAMILRRLHRKPEAKAAEQRARQALEAEGPALAGRVDLGALQAVGFQRR